MNTKREKEIFVTALEMGGPTERAAYLQGACGGDGELRARLEALLAAHEGQSQFPPDARGSDAISTLIEEVKLTEEPGTVIGRYKLLEKLGEGGFGSVWAAEQREPVKRRVALKIIKLGMDTKQVVARFEAERQALALMDHPNIAKVLDAGSTDTGRPYFVMELVKGIPITKYCDQEKLPTKDRLDLIIKVCHAIQHAHQKGIIHRDIKPSNIMVTLHDGVPVPKVIDFGIAKATQQELTELTIYTQHHQFIGTPAYMSPEQAEMSGLDIDTRSDIYSLGVLLYELLTGTTPFDTKELMLSGLEAMRKIIREREPVRPSTRLSQTLVAADLSQRKSGESGPVVSTRSAFSRRRLQDLRGDLDWIVMRCLEKDRTRRYDTANGLAMDLKRHLDNEPIVARPPSAAYRFQKAWKRNKVMYTSGIAVMAIFAIGLVTSLRQTLAATKAEEEKSRALIGERDQRIKAQASQREAEAARSVAEAERLKAQKNLYAADMVLASQALENGNLGKARHLLFKYLPVAKGVSSSNGPPTELRGWEWRNLWQRAQGGEEFVLRGHSQSAFACCMLADNRTALSGSDDGTIRLWDVPTRALLQIASFANSVRGLALSANGKRLLILGGDGGKWALWETPSCRPIATFTNEYDVNGAAFSPDGAQFAIATGSDVQIWKSSEPARIKTVPNQSDAWRIGMDYSPDGLVLAYAREGGRVVLLDLATGTQNILESQSQQLIMALKFTPDGRHVIGAGEAGTIRVWSVSDKKMETQMTNHQAQVSALAISPDGSLLASASADQTVRLWDTGTWSEKAVLQGHEAEVHSVAFSGDGEILISSGKDATVRGWNPRRSRAIRDRLVVPEGAGVMPGWCRGSKGFVVSGSGLAQTVTPLDFATMKEGPPVPFPTALQQARFTDTDAAVNWIAANTKDGVVEIWKAESLQWLHTLEVGVGPLSQLAMGETGRWLAIERAGSNVEIWNVEMGTKVKVMEPLLAEGGLWMPRLTFWGQDSLLVHLGATHDPESYVVDIMFLPKGETRRIVSTHKSSITCVAVSPDGELLATAGWDGEVKLWAIRTGKELGTLGGQLIGFTCLAFSDDGSRLAAGGWDGSITLWEVQTLQEVSHWKATGKACGSLVFVDGGRTLCSFGTMQAPAAGLEVRQWRAPSLQETDRSEAQRIDGEER